MKTANVEQEYKKNDQLKPEDVKSLKEWIEKQPHLPKITGNYNYIILFQFIHNIVYLKYLVRFVDLIFNKFRFLYCL